MASFYFCLKILLTAEKRPFATFLRCHFFQFRYCRGFFRPQYFAPILYRSNNVILLKIHIFLYQILHAILNKPVLNSNTEYRNKLGIIQKGAKVVPCNNVNASQSWLQYPLGLLTILPLINLNFYMSVKFILNMVYIVLIHILCHRQKKTIYSGD